jgi:hypothetical protein
MVHGAALVVGVGGAMIVPAAALMNVMMVGVLHEVGGRVVNKVLFCRGDMLKMNRDQWRNTGQLGDQKQAQKAAS